MEWISIDKELPKDCFDIAVLMYNNLSGHYETGIGIYDVSTKQFEVNSVLGESYPVKYWVKLPNKFLT